MFYLLLLGIGYGANSMVFVRRWKWGDFRGCCNAAWMKSSWFSQWDVPFVFCYLIDLFLSIGQGPGPCTENNGWEGICTPALVWFIQFHFLFGTLLSDWTYQQVCDWGESVIPFRFSAVVLKGLSWYIPIWPIPRIFFMLACFSVLF
jgi:hypothetical protein